MGVTIRRSKSRARHDVLRLEAIGADVQGRAAGLEQERNTKVGGVFETALSITVPNASTDSFLFLFPSFLRH
jgi:hypothetical protein